jgi:hypothetical protein
MVQLLLAFGLASAAAPAPPKEKAPPARFSAELVGDTRTGVILLPAKVPQPPQPALAVVTPKGEVAIFWEGRDIAAVGLAGLLKKLPREKVVAWLEDYARRPNEFLTQHWHLGVKDVQVYTAAGKRIDPGLVPKLLAKWTPVFLSVNGQPLDPLYLRVIKGDALILVFPRDRLKAGLPRLDPSPPPF